MPTPVPSPTPSPFPSPEPALYVSIFNGQDYGYVGAETAPGASCTARVILPNGQDAPGLRNPKVVGPDGLVSWMYPTLPTQEGIGVHTVTCNLNGLIGSGWATFDLGS